MTKLTLGLIGVLLISCVIGLSAFTSVKSKKHEVPKPLVNHYFQFTTNAADNEGSYESSGNWTYLGTTNPSTDPCSGDNEMVCVLEAPFASTPTTTDLVNYLSGLTPAATGAVTYCRNASNIKHKKPKP